MRHSIALCRPGCSRHARRFPGRPYRPSRRRSSRTRRLRPVEKDDTAGREGAGFDEPDTLRLQTITEEVAALAVDDRRDADPVLIEQPCVHQRLRQDGAAEDVHVAVALPLKPSHVLGAIPCHGGIPVGRLEGAGADDLREAVHVLGDGALRRLPVGRHALPGHAAENEHVSRAKLLEAQLLQLRAPGALVPGEVPVLLTLEQAVEADQVPHDELAHYPLPVAAAGANNRTDMRSFGNSTSLRSPMWSTMAPDSKRTKPSSSKIGTCPKGWSAR